MSLNAHRAGMDASVSNGDLLGSGSRLASYQTAMSGEATPTAAQSAAHTPWDAPYHRSASIASSSQASDCLL